MSRLEGKDRLEAAILRLPKDARKEIRTELRRIGAELQAGMRGAAPEYTGRLKRSIRMRMAARGLRVDVGQILNVEYRRVAFHGRFIEYGTAGYEKGERTKSRRVARRRVPARPARPFVRPVAARLLPEFRNRMDAILMRLVHA